MSDCQDLINIIRIVNTPGIGSVTFFKLLGLYNSIDKILQLIPGFLKGGVVIPSVDFAKQEIETAAKNNIKIILWNDKRYPQHLKSVYSKPVILYAKGNDNLLNCKSVGIVGTRNPTIIGKNFIFDLSNEITKNGFNIVSGMAIGIDTAAHKGAINDYNANTIAVLAGGVNDIYPPSNRLLYNEILNKNGLIVSEKPINYIAKANDFPKRNRIIAGLSIALIVSEATNRSGSLITAQYAMKQKKLIYAIPSHPSDARSYGPNNLIAKGAKIFLSKGQLIADLKSVSTSVCTNYIYNKEDSVVQDNYSNVNAIEDDCKSKVEDYILNMLSVNAIDTEELFQDLSDRYHISISEFSKLILNMELQGEIVNLNGQISKSNTI